MWLPWKFKFFLNIPKFVIIFPTLIITASYNYHEPPLFQFFLWILGYVYFLFIIKFKYRNLNKRNEKSYIKLIIKTSNNIFTNIILKISFKYLVILMSASTNSSLSNVRLEGFPNCQRGISEVTAPCWEILKGIPFRECD